MPPAKYPKATAFRLAEDAVTASPDLPSLEQHVLAYWEADATFEASVAQRPLESMDQPEYVFYDGPPFANGLPHYGHLLTGYIKDLIPRYRTMLGQRVERRFGWDTHGLPAELEAMKQLNMTTREEILEFGIEKFNAACKASVFRYTHEWRRHVTRQARWVDFDNDYKTLDLSFMESVTWAFKELYEKGLIYEGYRCLPYCWNDETPLSNHELRMDDDVYRDRESLSVTIGVRLESGELALVWTTTPWTLPANLALAVNPDFTYIVFTAALYGHVDRFVVEESRFDVWTSFFEDGSVSSPLERLSGAELVGRRYQPPFTYFADRSPAFEVLSADFVTNDEGTGIVHLAPAFGEDDQQVCEEHGIEPVVPVGSDGRFTDQVPEYMGDHVFDASDRIVQHLRSATDSPHGRISHDTVLVAAEAYRHSYPHCWRCRQPLIYMTVSSWFVATTKIRDRMLALNEQITWVPSHLKHGQFGKWLENTRDWSISRNRFWGCPIPVWKSDDPEYPRTDVYGSVEALERDFGVKVTDLHRPGVDELTRPNPDDPTGRATMRRVTDVLDCWFESGSMSFAQVHYPFENRTWFEDHFPGDFIVEYIGQTRGWFYTMHVLATALFDRPAFSVCLSHGIVLGSDGEKMSKSRQNYPDVNDIFDSYGADAMRWYLVSSPVLRSGNLIVSEEDITNVVRDIVLPFWNAWHFFRMYANAFGTDGYDARKTVSPTDPLDIYLLAHLGQTQRVVEASLNSYDISAACSALRRFIEDLTNWYIRRSRRRFWATDGQGSQRAKEAFDTLYTSLRILAEISAPFLPMVAEEIWRGLTGGRSVHLERWPDASVLPERPELVAAMEAAREVCSAALGLRSENHLRSRLPLRTLIVVSPVAEKLAFLTDLISDEVNVQHVECLEPGEARERGLAVEQRLSILPRVAGPRLGGTVQEVIRAAKAGDWSIDSHGLVRCGGVQLEEGEYALTPTSGSQPGRAQAILSDGGFVLLDVTTDETLEREGLANDVIRVVQQARREADLQVSDRIRLSIAGDEDVREAVSAHERRVVHETLAVSLTSGSERDAIGFSATVGNGSRVEVVVEAV